MAKKNKKQDKESTIENYYDLRTDAVDDLVEALKTGQSDDDIPTNIAEITGEEAKAKPGSKKAEFDPYRRDKLSGLPTWLKALFIKWWFAGCVCYFVMMGLGSLLGDPSPATNENLFLLTAVIYGIIVDVMVNPTFRYLESDRKEYNAYMMFPFPLKAFWTFFANIVYYFLVMFLVNMSINGINLAIKAMGGNSNVYFEPLLFGTLATLIDMIFIGIKDGIVYGVKKAKRKKQLAAEGIAAEADAAFGANLQNAETNAAAEEELPLTEDGQVDEVERLRRLAERRNADSGDGQRKKNKKK